VGVSRAQGRCRSCETRACSRASRVSPVMRRSSVVEDLLGLNLQRGRRAARALARVSTFSSPMVYVRISSSVAGAALGGASYIDPRVRARVRAVGTMADNLLCLVYDRTTSHGPSRLRRFRRRRHTPRSGSATAAGISTVAPLRVGSAIRPSLRERRPPKSLSLSRRLYSASSRLLS
jgi:hypothetical protein